MLDPKLLSEYNKTRKTKNKEIFCHAPFTSMNFEQNGNVTACCYNRSQVFGTYPDDSLETIWQSMKAQELRDKMKNNDFSAGCNLCKNQLLSENFAGLRARYYDNIAPESYIEENGKLINMPEIMEFEISNICNLECIMCTGYYSSAIRKHRENLQPLKNPYDDSFVDQLRPFIPYLKEAKFLGGEPFLINIYFKIWENIIKLNPSVEVVITTNGTILTDRVKDVLAELQAHIVISIDSLNKENYEKIRVNAKFESVMTNISYFKKYVKQKKTSLTFAICPMQQNWKEIPQIIEYCNESDIQIGFNTVLKPANVSLLTMRKNQLFEVSNYLESFIFPQKNDTQKYNSLQYNSLTQQLQRYYEHSSQSEFRNNGSIHEYKILLNLYESKYKLNEQDENNQLFNAIIFKILKRVAIQKSIGPVVYDKETLESNNYFFDNPDIFVNNEKIAQSLELIFQKTEIQRFIKEYFNIIKIIFSIVKDANNNLFKKVKLDKINKLSEIIVYHPAKKLIMKDIIGADIMFVLEFIKDFSTKQMTQIISSRYS